MDDRGLEDLFGKYGKLTRASVATDKYSGRSRGYGFVAFETRADADEAMKSLNGYEVEGRALRLDWDPGLDRKARTEGGGGGGGAGLSGGSVTSEPYEAKRDAPSRSRSRSRSRSKSRSRSRSR